MQVWGKAAICSARATASSRAAPGALTRLASPIRSASSAPTGRPVRIRSRACECPISRGSRMVPPSISGTPQRRQKTPNTARRVGDPQVAPQRELQAAGDGVALDGRDHRFRQQQPGRAHRRGTVGAGRIRLHRPGADRLEVGAGAEGAAGAGQDGDARVRVGVEGEEGVVQRLRVLGVDRVAHLRPVDRDDRDRATTLDGDRHQPILHHGALDDRRQVEAGRQGAERTAPVAVEPASRRTRRPRRRARGGAAANPGRPARSARRSGGPGARCRRRT